MKSLRIGRKKLLLAGVVVLLLAGVVFASASMYSNRRDKELAQISTTVNESLSKEGGGCSQQNIDSLVTLYNDSKSGEEKALSAERVAHCNMMKQQLDEAIVWYGRGEAEYRSLNNAEKAEAQKKARENAEMIKNYKPEPNTTGIEDPGDL